MTLQLLVPKVGKQNIGKVKRVKRIGKIKEVKRMEKMREIEKTIREIR